MNYRIFTLLISILFFNTLSFAQSELEDPIRIDGVKFGHISVSKPKQKWVKAEVRITSRGDLAAKKAGGEDMWLKDVEIGLVCAFSGTDKEQVWFSSDVAFYGLRKGESYILNFYIPAEVLEMNKIIRSSPEGYLINLSAGGVDYPLNMTNFKGRTSAGTADKAKNLMDAADAVSASSAGFMLYYDEAPFLIRSSDDNIEKQATSKPKK